MKIILSIAAIALLVTGCHLLNPDGEKHMIELPSEDRDLTPKDAPTNQPVRKWLRP